MTGTAELMRQMDVRLSTNAYISILGNPVLHAIGSAKVRFAKANQLV